jgi:predicted nucleic acid-binding protein
MPIDRPALVLDTNVVLDWLVFRDPAVATLAQAVATGAMRWLATPAMRAELARMLAHASLARWRPDSGQALAVFDRCARHCATAPPSRLRCSDADDQIFIDLALAERAGWLLTHDRALLRLARRARALGLRIAPPGALPDGG